MSPDMRGVVSEPIVLESFKYEKSEYVGRGYLADNLRMSVLPPDGDGFLRGYAGRFLLETRMLGKRLEPTEVTGRQDVEFEVWRTWWDHWKAQHADLWWARRLVRRWPPRTSTVTRYVTLTVNVERAAMFPEADALPSGHPLGSPVLVQLGTDLSWAVR